MLHSKMVNDVGIIMVIIISSKSEAYVLKASNNVYDERASSGVPITSVKITDRHAIA